MGAGCIAC